MPHTEGGMDKGRQKRRNRFAIDVLAEQLVAAVRANGTPVRRSRRRTSLSL